MNTKLTLRLDADLITRVKRVARHNQTSVSRMVERFFVTVTAAPGHRPLPPVLTKLSGLVPDRGTRDWRPGYRSRREKKHCDG